MRWLIDYTDFLCGYFPSDIYVIVSNVLLHVNNTESRLHSVVCSAMLEQFCSTEWNIMLCKTLECMLNGSLMECAKEMIRESLPIKCLEAVVLAMYPFGSCCC